MFAPVRLALQMAAATVRFRCARGVRVRAESATRISRLSALVAEISEAASGAERANMARALPFFFAGACRGSVRRSSRRRTFTTRCACRRQSMRLTATTDAETSPLAQALHRRAHPHSLQPQTNSSDDTSTIPLDAQRTDHGDDTAAATATAANTPR